MDDDDLSSAEAVERLSVIRLAVEIARDYAEEIGVDTASLLSDVRIDHAAYAAARRKARDADRVAADEG